MTDRRTEVVLARTRAAMESDVTEPQIDRLRTPADFRFGEFHRPTSWDEPPPPDAETDRRIIEFVGDAWASGPSRDGPRPVWIN